jgi:anti-anti-sigma factor
MTNAEAIEVYAGSPTGLRAQLLAAADETICRGREILVVGLNNISVLDDAAIAALIVSLRRLREAGGAIRLVTTNPEHRKRLALTSLDRIFEVFESAADARRAHPV